MIVPSILTLLFSLSLLALSFLLLLGPFFRRRQPDDSHRASLPESDPPRKTLGSALTNRWLRVWQTVFVIFALAVFGFHSYWAFFAAGPLSGDPEYLKLKDARDQRNRRLQEAGLRGWIYDRKASSYSALAIYQMDGGQITRRYPLDAGGGQLVGYSSIVRGKAGLEKALDDTLMSPASAYNALVSSLPAGTDVVTTIDADLQARAAQLLESKRGAVVVIDPRNGDILALASSPTYSPASIDDEPSWQALVSDRSGKPLLNRATSEYYLPGSTFKSVVAAAAIADRLDHLQFTCKAEGFISPGASKPIEDDDHGAHGRIGLTEAFTVSCNQYFAQLGLALGASRLADEARKFDIHIDASAEASRTGLFDRDIWNAKVAHLQEAFGPRQARMVLSPKLAPYDLAIEAFGQGFHQTTVLQMALVAATIANQSGEMMRAKIERDIPPRRFGTSIGSTTASRLRQLMVRVVERGTARAAFAGCLVPSAGKTGTAQFQQTNPDNGSQRPRIDAWFIGFAPAANPQIAFAVLVEDGGHGGAAAAPIARGLVDRALRNGLIGAGKTGRGARP